MIFQNCDSPCKLVVNTGLVFVIFSWCKVTLAITIARSQWERSSKKIAVQSTWPCAGIDVSAIRHLEMYTQCRHESISLWLLFKRVRSWTLVSLVIEHLCSRGV